MSVVPCQRMGTGAPIQMVGDCLHATASLLYHPRTALSSGDDPFG